MKTSAEKQQQEESFAVANKLLQAQNRTMSAAYVFFDNRPEGVAQRKLQDMANRSVLAQLSRRNNTTTPKKSQDKKEGDNAEKQKDTTGGKKEVSVKGQKKNEDSDADKTFDKKGANRETGGRRGNEISVKGRQKDQSTVTDLQWNPKDVDDATLVKIANAYIRMGVEVDKLSARLEAPRDSLVRVLIEIAKKHALPLKDSEIAEAKKKTEETEAINAVIIDNIEQKDPGATKKYRINPGSHEIDRTTSAGARLEKKNKETPNWTKEVIESLKPGSQSKKNSFLDIVSASPLFYGTTDGQRMHILASKFLKGKNLDMVEHEKLRDEVTRKLDAGAKEKWPEVSNFWLDNPGAGGVGLAGERQKGVKVRAGESTPLSEDKLLSIYSDSIELLNKIIDLRTDHSNPNGRQLFLAQFRREQSALLKDWHQDVDREDYAHKPGSRGIAIVKDLQYEDLICRRMCKWMLHVAAYNDQPVIYALDEIDLNSVAEAKTLEINDTVSNTGVKKLKVPVCTSELREIFRAQDKMISDKPKEGVKFFKELMPEEAPWGAKRKPEELKPWAEYALHLTKKLLIQYPGDRMLVAAGEEMIALCFDQKYAEIIQVYKKMKPSELLPQGAMPVKNNRKDRLATHESLMKDTKHLIGATDVINSLEGCILRLNSKDRLDLAKLSKGTKITNPLGKSQEPLLPEQKVITTTSNPESKGIVNLGQTCYLAAGLTMLAFNFKHLFVEAHGDMDAIKDLKRTIKAVLDKITNNELVSEIEIRTIIMKIAPYTVAQGQQSASPGEKEDTVAKELMVVAQQNIIETEKTQQTVTAGKKQEIQSSGEVKRTKEEQEIDREIISLAYHQQDVSDIIFGKLFEILVLDTSTHRHVVTTTRDRYMGAEAMDKQINVPQKETLEGYTAFPQIKRTADFKLELPIGEASTFQEALQAFKGPGGVIPDVKNVQGQELHESTATETNSFDQAILPATFTIILKRFNYNQVTGLSAKIGKAIVMPKNIVLGNTIYDLGTVVFHQGSYDLGHYTSSIKQKDNTWKHHDDSRISSHDTIDQDQNNGYIYVYKKTAVVAQIGDDYPRL
jgi:hypothetical protein